MLETGGDGVLAAGHTGTMVGTGTPWGVVQLDIHLNEPLPPLEELDVAARCSLFLPTGRLMITNPDDGLAWEAQVGSSQPTVALRGHNLHDTPRPRAS